MSNFVGIIVGGLEIIAGVVGFLLIPGFGVALANYLIFSGAGILLGGLGTMIASAIGIGGPGSSVAGTSFASRNPAAPWQVCIGRCMVGGTVIFINEFGENNKYLDLVIILAAHPSQSVDTLLFDTQMVQLAETTPSGWVGGGTSYDSFTPVQQTVSIVSIVRFKNVVTVTLSQSIPLLQPNNRIRIQNTSLGSANAVLSVESTTATADQWDVGEGYFTGDVVAYNNSSYRAVTNSVGEIPASNPTYWEDYNVFTAICGGEAGTETDGEVVTLWPDYGRHVHMEVLGVGNSPTWTETFKGMLYGTPNEGDPDDLILNPDNPWGATAVVGGMTAVLLRLNYDQKIFSGGMPQIAFLFHGKNNIMDPRTSPPTIGYSENAALAIADYLADETWGFSAEYATEIPLAQLIVAANICDESVALAIGGNEPRYAISGKFDLTQPRGNILQNLLTSCAGRITYIGGQFIIWPAAWYGSSPVAAPDYSQMSGPFRWKPTVSIRDLFNGVKGIYICPANNWQPGDIPPYAQDTTHGYTIGDPWSIGVAYVIGNIVSYADADWICLANNTGNQPDVSPSFWTSIYEDINLIEDGGQRRWLDIQLPFTISAPTAQRLCKIELLRRRQQGTGTFRFNMAGYAITTLDIISMTVPYLGWSGKLVEVLAARFVIDRQNQNGVDVTLLGTEIDVQETDAAVYDWSDTEELTPQGYQQSAVPDPFTPAPPTGLTLESDESTLVVTPQGLVDSILVTWDQPVDGYVLQGGHMEIRYEEIEAYTAGYVVPVNGSQDVDGVGTTWTADMVGGTIVINGVSYGILEVTGPADMKLAITYAGATVPSIVYTILFSAAWIGLPSVNPTVTKVNINGVVDGHQYNVEIRSVNGLGVPSDWVFAGPVTAKGQNAPLPYKPYAENYSYAPSGFGIGLSQVAGPSGTNSIAITGTPPVNAFSDIIPYAPIIDSYAIVSSHVGNVMQVGTFYAQVFPIDQNGKRGPGSNLTQFDIPSEFDLRASFTVTFPPGTVEYELFVGLDPANLYGQFAVSAGSPPLTTINIDSFVAVGGYGPPDQKAVAYHARAKRTIHGGIAAAYVVTSNDGPPIVGPSTIGISIPSAASADEFAGRDLIVVSRAGLPGTQAFSVIPILHNDTGSPICTLTVPTLTNNLVTIGDLVLISTKSTVATLTSITDSGLVSPYAPTGLGTTGSPPAGVEIGNQLVVLYDPTGAAQAGTTVDITGNSGTTVYTTPFPVPPGNGTRFIIVEKSWRQDVVSSLTSNSVAPDPVIPAPIAIASIPTVNLSGYVALVELLLQDQYGSNSDEEGDGLRMLYIVPPAQTSLNPGYSEIVPVAGTATIDLADGLLQEIFLDASAVNFAAPVNSDGPLLAGQYVDVCFANLVDNPTLPTFTHALGAFVDQVPATIAWDPRADRSVTVRFVFRGNGFWAPNLPGAYTS